ncbi:hypothetical protein KGM_211298 [Danaus plexippus plexippus]|uniref:Uncharacterized protein n=1 Tax=Danaus plexippus plexippus TaxID=278856 RepID=A0A212FKM3_DANPL|nr:hypothetical protein KGM_211298 [Danaus plexippus plexippus]
MTWGVVVGGGGEVGKAKRRLHRASGLHIAVISVQATVARRSFDSARGLPMQ